MAIRKNIITPAGPVASYHRIVGLMIHEWERRAQIYLQGFIDERHRRAVNKDGSPKFSQACASCLTVDGDKFAELFGDGAAAYPGKPKLYDYVLRQPEFKGGVKS